MVATKPRKGGVQKIGSKLKDIGPTSLFLVTQDITFISDDVSSVDCVYKPKVDNTPG